jgi:hypothetical protein
MMKYVFAGLAALALVASVFYWLQQRDHEAEKRGVDQQVARDIAKANQEIATRRVTDAKFDSQDARALCLSYGLEWVSEQGKSFCR